MPAHQNTDPEAGRQHSAHPRPTHKVQGPWADRGRSCHEAAAVNLRPNLAKHRSEIDDLSKGSRSAFLAKCFFEDRGYQGQATTLFQEHNIRLASLPQAARQTKPLVSGTCVVFRPWYPRPPKNHLAQTPLRDPFGRKIRDRSKKARKLSRVSSLP